MQQQPATNFKAFLRTLSIIHLAMMSGLLIFSVFIITTSKEMGTLSFTQQPFEFLIPALLIGAVFIGNFISKTILSKVNKDQSLQQKLGIYQTAHIIRIAPVEGIGLFAAVTYSGSKNLLFLLIAVLALLILFTLIPTKEKIESAIPINSEDQVYLRNTEKPFES
ncbi:hypothetical protein [uncultured Dokdonia sp.]|uniref:hypothetical protein n=1 Tax=uncultured Dokdonia sp. TaxID=575653 RepID=UPI00263467FE|nr:hypothetical protein [uncultured Dokdonia sp.]